MAVNAAGKPAAVSIDNVAYTGPLVIGGSSFDVAVSVSNSSRSALRDVAVVTRARQGAAVREAGRAQVTCPGAVAGVFPGNASCVVNAMSAVTNSGAGTGTLVAGDADFEVLLVQGRKESILASAAESVTLTALPALAPSITSVQLASSEFVLDNGVQYTTNIVNPGPARPNLILQAEVVQGQSVRAASGFVFDIAEGSSAVQAMATATNNDAGSGDLAPGPAQLVVQLIDGTTALDSHTFDIVIGPTGTPYIKTFWLDSTTFQLGGSGVAYTAVISNPLEQIVEGVTIRGRIWQGDVYREAGSEIVRGCEGGFEHGDLPPNSECTVGGSFVANNTNGGSDGTLQPGSAILEVLIRSQQVILHSFTRAIVLVDGGGL
jgi:hypothetical protein